MTVSPYHRWEKGSPPAHRSAADGTDLIGLEDGMEYSDLLIQSGGGGTEIALQGTGEILAVLDGIMPNLLDQSDFVAMA